MFGFEIIVWRCGKTHFITGSSLPVFIVSTVNLFSGKAVQNRINSMEIYSKWTCGLKYTQYCISFVLTLQWIFSIDWISCEWHTNTWSGFLNEMILSLYMLKNLKETIENILLKRMQTKGSKILRNGFKQTFNWNIDFTPYHLIKSVLV